MHKKAANPPPQRSDTPKPSDLNPYLRSHESVPVGRFDGSSATILDSRSRASALACGTGRKHHQRRWLEVMELICRPGGKWCNMPARFSACGVLIGCGAVPEVDAVAAGNHHPAVGHQLLCRETFAFLLC